MSRIERRLHEAEMSVVRSGRIVLCLHGKGTDSSMICHQQSTIHCVTHESDANAATLPIVGDGQPRKYHQWNWIPRHSLFQPIRSIHCRDFANHEGVVTDDVFVDQRNKGSRGTGFLRLQSMDNEKAVKRQDAAIKLLNFMIAP